MRVRLPPQALDEGRPAVWAIEVKSGRPARTEGLAGFLRRHPRAHPLIVGTGGMSLKEFFSTDPGDLFGWPSTPALVVKVKGS